jgi:hypothetical protein
VTWVDSQGLADRLGLPQEAVGELQRHGVLRRFDFDEPQIRERLYLGHLAFLERRRKRGGAESREH